jgi:hypothetical protein
MNEVKPAFIEQGRVDLRGGGNPENAPHEDTPARGTVRFLKRPR